MGSLDETELLVLAKTARLGARISFGGTAFHFACVILWLGMAAVIGCCVVTGSSPGAAVLLSLAVAGFYGLLARISWVDTQRRNGDILPRVALLYLLLAGARAFC